MKVASTVVPDNMNSQDKSKMTSVMGYDGDTKKIYCGYTVRSPINLDNKSK